MEKLHMHSVDRLEILHTCRWLEDDVVSKLLGQPFASIYGKQVDKCFGDWFEAMLGSLFADLFAGLDLCLRLVVCQPHNVSPNVSPQPLPSKKQKVGEGQQLKLTRWADRCHMMPSHMCKSYIICNMIHPNMHGMGRLCPEWAVSQSQAKCCQKPKGFPSSLYSSVTSHSSELMREAPVE